MPDPPAMAPGDVFAPGSLALRVCERVAELLRDVGDVQIRTTRTQVAFRRRRGFAYVWDPRL